MLLLIVSRKLPEELKDKGQQHVTNHRMHKNQSAICSELNAHTSTHGFTRSKTVLSGHTTPHIGQQP